MEKEKFGNAFEFLAEYFYRDFNLEFGEPEHAVAKFIRDFPLGDRDPGRHHGRHRARAEGCQTEEGADRHPRRHRARVVAHQGRAAGHDRAAKAPQLRRGAKARERQQQRTAMRRRGGSHGRSR